MDHRSKWIWLQQGETADQYAEFYDSFVFAGTHALLRISADSNYELIESKAQIEEGDYFENIAFVGKTMEGKNIIAILENALCTSGFEQEGKNKEGAVGKYTFECHAELDGDLATLPWHIYYPVVV